MKKWRIVVETESGGYRYRWTEAESLNRASDKVRARIPASWRIVSVEEVPEEEYRRALRPDF